MSKESTGEKEKTSPVVKSAEPNTSAPEPKPLAKKPESVSQPADEKSADPHWAEWKAKNGEGDATAPVLLEEYKDAGYWGRHYSTVRMTLGTFFLTAASGIIYHQMEKPDWKIAILAIGIASLGCFLFGLFSYCTFNEMNKQLQVVNVYRAALAKDKQRKAIGLYNPYLAFTGIPLGLIVFSVFCALAVAWALSKPKEPEATETKLPVTVQIDQNPPVKLDVTIKVQTAK